jgi:diaminopimelate decarboxylase
MRNATEIDHLIFDNILHDNDAAFIFHEEKFRVNLRTLHSSFTEFYPKVVIGYSYKTNYTPDVCLTAHEEGAMAEVVSEMEVEMALVHLKDKSKIIYNGPVKTASSIKSVISSGGIINIDNQRDIDIITNFLSQNPGLNANVAFRLNIDYSENCSRFGQPVTVIEDQIRLLNESPQFNIMGFHLHLPYRSLESFEFRVEALVESLERFNLSNLEYVNIGGGFFGQLSPVLKQALGIKKVPSFRDYGQLIGVKLMEYFSQRQDGLMPTLYLEPGSSVIADCFTFVSKIHTEKSFANRNLLVSYAGRHLLSPTNKSIKLPCEIINVNNSSDINKSKKRQYDIVGYTCIESDILGEVEGCLVADASNSFVEFLNVGSYSVVMGSNFILPEPPIFKIDRMNNLKTVRDKRHASDVLNQFLI